MYGAAIVGMVLAALLGESGLGIDEGRAIHRLDPARASPILAAWTDEQRERFGQDDEPRRQANAIERLSALLLGRDGLALEERIGTTPTASGAFLTRRANCLALAHLAVAIGRRNGLDLMFVEVTESPRVDRAAEMRIVHRHAAVAIRTDLVARNRIRVFDFSGVQSLDTARVRILTDHQARGLFYANRGAEALIDGRADDALPWLEAAIELIETDWLWRNLSLALARAGRPAAAAVARDHARNITQSIR